MKGTNGTFYGSTLLGGTYFYGTLFNITTTGDVSFVYSFTGGADGGDPNSLAPGSRGSLYGTASFNGMNASDPGTIFSFTP